MRSKIIIAFVTAALTITAGVFAQSSGGGYPSKPKFTSVGVGTAAPATSGAINATGQVTLTKTYSTSLSGALTISAAVPVMDMVAATAVADSKRFRFYADSAGALHGQVVNDIDTVGTDWLTVNRTTTTPTTINLIATNVQASGRRVLSNYITGQINSAGNLVSGHGASAASTSGTGLYRLTFSATAPGFMVCTVSVAGVSSAIYPTIATGNPGTFVDLNVFNGVGGSLVNIPGSTNLNVICTDAQ